MKPEDLGVGSTSCRPSGTAARKWTGRKFVYLGTAGRDAGRFHGALRAHTGGTSPVYVGKEDLKSIFKRKDLAQIRGLKCLETAALNAIDAFVGGLRFAETKLSGARREIERLGGEVPASGVTRPEDLEEGSTYYQYLGFVLAVRTVTYDGPRGKGWFEFSEVSENPDVNGMSVRISKEKLKLIFESKDQAILYALGRTEASALGDVNTHEDGLLVNRSKLEKVRVKMKPLMEKYPEEFV